MTTLTPQEQEAQELIVTEIENAFNLVLQHLKDNSVPTNGMVSVAYVEFTHTTIIAGLKKGIDNQNNKEDDNTQGN